MSILDKTRDTRPVACCREPANLTPIAVEGSAGDGVIRREGEQCMVCGRRHLGGAFAPGAAGVQPAVLGR